MPAPFATGRRQPEGLLCRPIACVFAEKTGPWKTVGRLGVGSFGEPQMRCFFMGTNAIVGAVALIFLIAGGCVALSRQETHVKKAHWIKGECLDVSKCMNMEIFVGLKAANVNGQLEVYDGNVSNRCIVYSPVLTANAVAGSGTPIVPTKAGNLCTRCYDVEMEMVAGIVVGTLTQALDIYVTLTRLYQGTDVNCFKLLGMINSVVGAVLLLATIGSFKTHCSKGWQSLGDPELFKWTLGPGFVLTICALCFKGLNLLFHAIVPTPPHCWDDEAMLAFMKRFPQYQGESKLGGEPEIPPEPEDEYYITEEDLPKHAMRVKGRWYYGKSKYKIEIDEAEDSGEMKMYWVRGAGEKQARALIEPAQEPAPEAFGGPMSPVATWRVNVQAGWLWPQAQGAGEIWLRLEKNSGDPDEDTMSSMFHHKDTDRFFKMSAQRTKEGEVPNADEDDEDEDEGAESA